MSKDCDRFRKIRLVAPDTEWSASEVTFFETHLVQCRECQEFLGDLEAASGALRESAYLPVVDSEFTNRVADAVGKDRFRRQLETWRPTLVGAVTAAIVFATVLQLLTLKPSLKQFSPQGTAIVPDRPARIFDTAPASETTSKTREG